MQNNNGKDLMDDKLSKALGDNKSEPDFEGFCSEHPDAVKALRENAAKQ